MKKFAVILIVLGMFNTVDASCIPSYKQELKQKYVQSVLTTAATPLVEYGALFTVFAGIMMSNNGVVVSGYVVGASGVPLLASGLYNFTRAVSITVAKNLLAEAEVGMGHRLSNLTEMLSEELGEEIDEQVVADILVRGSQRLDFCQENDLPYNSRKLYEYVREELI